MQSSGNSRNITTALYDHGNIPRAVAGAMAVVDAAVAAAKEAKVAAARAAKDAAATERVVEKESQKVSYSRHNMIKIRAAMEQKCSWFCSRGRILIT